MCCSITDIAEFIKFKKLYFVSRVGNGSMGPILLLVYAFYEAYKRIFLPSPPTMDVPPMAPGKEDLASVDSPAEAETMALQHYRDAYCSAI